MESPKGGGGFDPFAQGGPRVLRFRARREGPDDSTQRRYQATYSYGDGWSRFRIDLDLARSTLSLYRTPGDDYRQMLLELAGRPPGLQRIPTPKAKVDSLTFDMEVIGLRMSGVQPAVGASGRSGDWAVIQAFVPGGTDSFLLGTNDRLTAGEIVIARPDSTRAVVLALAKLFG